MDLSKKYAELKPLVDRDRTNTLETYAKYEKLVEQRLEIRCFRIPTTNFPFIIDGIMLREESHFFMFSQRRNFLRLDKIHIKDDDCILKHFVQKVLDKKNQHEQEYEFFITEENDVFDQKHTVISIRPKPTQI